MQELQAGENLGGVEAGALLGELLGLDNVKHEVAAVEELHEKEEELLILERAEELGEEVVVPREFAHVALHHGALDVVVLQHDVLLERLHRVVLVAALGRHEEHLAERALADQLLDAKVLQGHASAIVQRGVAAAASERAADAAAVDQAARVVLQVHVFRLVVGFAADGRRGGRLGGCQGGGALALVGQVELLALLAYALHVELLDLLELERVDLVRAELAARFAAARHRRAVRRVARLASDRYASIALQKRKHLISLLIFCIVFLC